MRADAVEDRLFPVQSAYVARWWQQEEPADVGAALDALEREFQELMLVQARKRRLRVATFIGYGPAAATTRHRCHFGLERWTPTHFAACTTPLPSPAVGSRHCSCISR